MSEFSNPLLRWNTRFAGDDYLFGEEPNAFIRRQTHRFQRGDTVLCVADGEGRNSVWLGEHALTVTAFDFAPNAVAKAKRLAARHKVSVDHQIGDLYAWNWTSRRYDAVVAIFIQFVPPERRSTIFADMRSAVQPGGLFLLEGYRPEQLEYGTGGPPRRDHMYTRDWLDEQFAGWEILELEAYDAVIDEGQAHSGMSALIDFVARKPNAP